jgi:hypothetical protein
VVEDEPVVEGEAVVYGWTVPGEVFEAAKVF